LHFELCACCCGLIFENGDQSAKATGIILDHPAFYGVFLMFTKKFSTFLGEINKKSGEITTS